MGFKVDKDSFIKVAKDTAIARGGLCLSEEYLNNKAKLIWSCNKHQKEWSASFKSVVTQGSWCPECGKEQRYQALQSGIQSSPEDRLREANTYAIEHGGKCLSTEYKNVSENLEWFCSQHQTSFLGNFNTIVNQKKWCPECEAEDRQKKRGLESAAQLERAKSYAENRGGVCLSTEYTGTSGKLSYRCSNPSHEVFEAVFDDTVNKGTWCPKCSIKNIGENRVRLMFETFFNEKFVNCRPDWNLSSDDIHPHISEAERLMLKVKPKKVNKIELDGYAVLKSGEKIAFEYQGDHHYNLMRYGDNISRLKRYARTSHNDLTKIENCQKNGVSLYIIPEVPREHQKKVESFVAFVQKVLLEQGLNMTFSEEQMAMMASRYGEV